MSNNPFASFDFSQFDTPQPTAVAEPEQVTPPQATAQPQPNTAVTLDQLSEYYGVGNGRNQVRFSELLDRLKNDNQAGLTHDQMLAIQGQWIKNYDNEYKGVKDPLVRQEYEETRQKIMDNRLLPRTAGNVFGATGGATISQAGADLDAGVTKLANTAFRPNTKEELAETTAEMEKRFPWAKGKTDQIMDLISRRKIDGLTTEKLGAGDFDAAVGLYELTKELNVKESELQQYAALFEQTADQKRDSRIMHAHDLDPDNLVRYSEEELKALHVPDDVIKKAYKPDGTGGYLLSQQQEANAKQYNVDYEKGRVLGLNERQAYLAEGNNAIKEILSGGIGLADIASYTIDAGASTVKQLPERAIQLGLAVATRGGSLAQSVIANTVWNGMTNMRIDTREDYLEFMRKKAKEKGLDFNSLSPDQLYQLEQEAITDGSLPKEMEASQVGSVARSVTEILTEGSLEKLSGVLKNLGNKAPGTKRKIILNFLSGVASFLGEPVSEVHGDVANSLTKTYLEKGTITKEDIAKAYEGAGNTFLASIFTGENAITQANKVYHKLKGDNVENLPTPAQPKSGGDTDEPVDQPKPVDTDQPKPVDQSSKDNTSTKPDVEQDTAPEEDTSSLDKTIAEYKRLTEEAKTVDKDSERAKKILDRQNEILESFSIMGMSFNDAEKQYEERQLQKGKQDKTDQAKPKSEPSEEDTTSNFSADQIKAFEDYEKERERDKNSGLNFGSFIPEAYGKQHQRDFNADYDRWKQLQDEQTTSENSTAQPQKEETVSPDVNIAQQTENAQPENTKHVPSFGNAFDDWNARVDEVVKGESSLSGTKKAVDKAKKDGQLNAEEHSQLKDRLNTLEANRELTSVINTTAPKKHGKNNKQVKKRKIGDIARHKDYISVADDMGILRSLRERIISNDTGDGEAKNLLSQVDARLNELEKQNEHRKDNISGGKNANRQAHRSNVKTSNSSGAEGSGKTSKQVQTTEAKATTEGPKKSDTGVAKNTSGKPNNHKKASNTVGTGQSARNANPESGEPRDVRANGVGKNQQPVTVVQEKHTNAGVSTGAEGNRSGEAPVAEKKAEEQALTADDVTLKMLAAKDIDYSPLQNAFTDKEWTGIKKKTAPYFQTFPSYVQLDQIAKYAISEDAKKLKKDSDAYKWFARIREILAGVVATITLAVGINATVPKDAVAEQGFSQYTTGVKIDGVSQKASNTINWVVSQADHKGHNFVVADKEQGKIHIVSPQGKVLNTQNALFGKGKGDSLSGYNTPSGRFTLHKTLTKNLNAVDRRVFGDSVLDLTDPKTGRAVKSNAGTIAMHRVVNKAERKNALNTASPNDNFLSHGCINIPTAFYDTAVDTLDGAMMYVLDQANEQVESKTATNKANTKQADSKTTIAKEDTKPTKKTNGLKKNSGVSSIKPTGKSQIKPTGVSQLKFSTNKQSSFDRTAEQLGGETAYRKAKADGKTNLTYKQWVQVRTPEFKDWFGDWENDPKNASKVIDTQTGEPLVVYHGTESEFTEFDLKQARQNADIPAFFFSNKEDDSEGYGSNVAPYYLNIRNMTEKPIVNMDGSKVRDELVRKGYDGTISSDDVTDPDSYTEYAALYPNQIKSATDNVGTFSKESNDIRHSQKPKKADLSQVNPKLNESKVQATLDKVLGKLAKNVTLISRDQFGHKKGYEIIHRNGIEGLYDPETKNIYIVADNINATKSLTAEERVAWVAWHEMAHAGLDVKYGKDLNDVLSQLKDDYFISELAKQIQLDRSAVNSRVAVNNLTAIEEALAELNAALKLDKLDHLTERYGVTIPKEFREFTQVQTETFLDKLRKLFRKVLGTKKIMNNNQVLEMLKGLPEDLSPYQTARSVERTEHILDLINDPDSVYNEAVKLSVMGDAWNKVADLAYPMYRKIFYGEKPVDSAGMRVEDVDLTKAQTERKEHYLNPAERFEEAMIDSQVKALKYVGGLTTDIGMLIKTTTNKIAQQQGTFQRRLSRISQDMGKVARKYYKGKEANVDRDVQLANTALAAMSGLNDRLLEKYDRLLNGYDMKNKDGEYILDQDGNRIRKKGLKDELRDLGIANPDAETNMTEIATDAQARRIASLLKEYHKLSEAYEQTKKSINRLMYEKHARDGEDPKTMRKNLRVYNGMTTAEAYAVITNLVKTGRIDVTYAGQKWENWIKEVGFDPEKGFKNENDVYTLSDSLFEISGPLAKLMDQTAKMSREIHEYKVDKLGKDLAGEEITNRFEMPTMGDPGNWLTEVDKDGSFIRKGDTTTIDEDIENAEAAEWQNQRLGRATLGHGAMQNLNMASQLAVKQTGYQPLFEKIYKEGMKENAPFKIRVVSTTEPNFNATKGGLLYVDVLDSKGRKTGYKKYVKVSFDNNEANEALFGDNIKTADNIVMNGVASVNRVTSLLFTSTPWFAVINGYRGFREKIRQIMAWEKGHPEYDYFVSQLDPRMQKMFKANNTGQKLSNWLYWNAFTSLVKNFPAYMQAVGAFTFYLADVKGKRKHGNWLVGNGAKEAFARLLHAHEQGAISTRAGSMRLSPEDLQKLYKRGGLTRGIYNFFDNWHEYAMLFTTMFESLSTLITQDLLMKLGMSRTQANQTNLYFMNFNDRGASTLSAYLRAAKPFANATAQGARSTARSFKSKNGMKSLVRSAMYSYGLMTLSAMLQDALGCPDATGKPFEDVNESTLQRSIPFGICGFGFRLPIAYGAESIAHAIGVALYQYFNGNWTAKQARDFVIHTALENILFIPISPNDKDNPFVKAALELAPSPMRVMINIMRDKDDFGNNLSAPGASKLQNAYLMKKQGTAEGWRTIAQFINEDVGLNPTPEAVKYAVTSMYGAVGEVMDAALKEPTEDETRFGNILFAMGGTKAIWTKQRPAQQRAFIAVSNNLSRYPDYTKLITDATEQTNEYGKKILRFSMKDSTLETWLADLEDSGKYSEEDLAFIRVIAEYQQRQKRISAKRVANEDQQAQKSEMFYDSNKLYLEEIRQLQEQYDR